MNPVINEVGLNLQPGEEEICSVRKENSTSHISFSTLKANIPEEDVPELIGALQGDSEDENWKEISETDKSDDPLEMMKMN